MQMDLCPRANRWVYWMKNPFFTIVLAALASGVCACCLNGWLWMPTVLLAVVAAGGLLLPVYSARSIRLKVTFDVRRTRVGEPVVVRLNAENRGWLPVWGLSVIRGLSASDSADSEEGVSLARVPARAEMEWVWEFTPSRRGVLPCGTMEVETGFPFGLVRASREVEVRGSLIVWPRTVSITGLPDAAESHSEDEFSDRRAGHFGDVLGAREFRTGDSLRSINWSQTARRQTLVVNERQAPQSSTVKILVDLRREAHSTVDRETTECLIATAASLCHSLHAQHCRIECDLGGKLLIASEATHGYQSLMDAFATCGIGGDWMPSKRESGFEIMVTTPQGLETIRRARSVVVHDAELSAPANCWLTVAGWDGLSSEFPGRWKGSCRVAG